MPTYQYRCAKCGEQFELWQSIHDDSLKQPSRVRRQGDQGALAGGHRAQGLRLLPHRQPRRGRQVRLGDTEKSKDEKDEKPAKEGAESSGNGSGDASNRSGSADSKGSTGSRAKVQGLKDSKPSKKAS